MLYICRRSSNINHMDIKDMTNDEFINHLMTGYNRHGALVQMVIIDCLQRGRHYISHKDVSSRIKSRRNRVAHQHGGMGGVLER